MNGRSKYHGDTKDARTEIRRLYRKESKPTIEISRILCLPLSSVEYYAYGKDEL